MIDIIITAYNAHKTIVKTLLSIEKQTLKKLVKVYIIDDHSQKDYNYLLELFENKLDITIIRNEKNLAANNIDIPGFMHSRKLNR